MKKNIFLAILFIFLMKSMLFAYPYAEIDYYESQINNGEVEEKYDTYSSQDYVSYYGASGQVFYYRNHSVTPGGISLNKGDSIAYSNGYADSANMKMGVSSTVNSYAYRKSSDARVTSTTKNMFTVLPSEDSEINIGDLVTLDFSYRIDGSLSASDFQNDGSYSPWSTIGYGMSLRDPSILIDLGIDGMWNPKLLELSGGALLQGYQDWTGVSASWDEQKFDHELQDITDLGYWSDYYESYGSSAKYYFDTQTRNLQFEVIAGNPIYLEADLEAWIMNYSTTNSKVDFYDTFGMNLAAAEGTYIDWENSPTEQVNPVPEPTTWLLLGIGVLVIGIGKRKLLFNKLNS